MLSIHNLNENPQPTGEHSYLLRINKATLCTFVHRREEGLAACLRRAADAVEKAAAEPAAKNTTILAQVSYRRLWWHQFKRHIQRTLLPPRQRQLAVVMRHLHSNLAPIEPMDLFMLHHALRPHVPCTWRSGDGYMTHGRIRKPNPHPADVPALMTAWLELLNGYIQHARQGLLTAEEGVAAYAVLHLSLVRVHPWTDGNGRTARVVSNLPLLIAGHTPVEIDRKLLATYHALVWDTLSPLPPLHAGEPLLPDAEVVEPFRQWVLERWRESARRE